MTSRERLCAFTTSARVNGYATSTVAAAREAIAQMPSVVLLSANPIDAPT